MSRAEYWNPKNLGYQFLAEAKRLWELESGKSRITTVQAAVSLNMVYNACGADKIGSEYTVQAVRMARKLKLFNQQSDIVCRETRMVMAYTGWSLFMWTAYVCPGIIKESTQTFYSTMGMHFCQRPLIEEPPEADLPDPSMDPEWYGETWLKYPLNQTLSPAHFGYFFRARARFFIIVNEIAKQSFNRATGPCRLSNEQVLRFYVRLLEWYSHLETPLIPEKIVLPNQLKLQ